MSRCSRRLAGVLSSDEDAGPARSSHPWPLLARPPPAPFAARPAAVRPCAAPLRRPRHPTWSGSRGETRRRAASPGSPTACGSSWSKALNGGAVRHRALEERLLPVLKTSGGDAPAGRGPWCSPTHVQRLRSFIPQVFMERSNAGPVLRGLELYRCPLSS